MTSAFSRPGRLLAILIAAALGSTILLATALEAPAKKKDPKGSYTLKKDQYRKGHGLRGLICDTRKTTWVAGSRVRMAGGGSIVFLPYAAQIRNLQTEIRTSSSSKSTTKLKWSLKKARSNQKEGTKKCANLKALGGGNTAGSGGGNSAGSGANRRPFDRTIRWLPFTRSRSTCQSTSAPATNELRFALCGKEGIVRAGSARRGGLSTRAGSSDVKTFASNGDIQDAVTEGTVSISTIAVGPTGWTYMGLGSPVNLAGTSSNSGTPCAFIRVREATGVPECVDSSVRSVTEIQFDNNGVVFYRGSNGSVGVLRRKDDAGITDLITTSANIGAYAVMPSGSVVMSGRSSNGSGWVRKVSSSGELTNIFATGDASFVRLFPDGNVYIGIWHMNSAGMGVHRFLADGEVLDPVLWIGGNTNNQDTQEYWDVSSPALCPSGANPQTWFCGFYGTSISRMVTTQSGHVIAIAGCASCTGSRLLEYWPEVKYLTSALTDIDLMTPAGDELVLAGTNSAGQNLLTAYNPATDSERTLIGAGGQVEIYNVAYSASTGEVFFDGLRFSNNSYVIGKVNVATGALTYLGTTGISFADFQAF
jgi:hypothetical protein